MQFSWVIVAETGVAETGPADLSGVYGILEERSTIVEIVYDKAYDRATTGCRTYCFLW